MASKKLPPGGGRGASASGLRATRDDAERAQQAAEEALWVESADEALEEVNEMYSLDDAEEGGGDDEGEGEDMSRDETSQRAVPDTHELKTLKQVAEIAEEELKDPEAFPVLHPEYKVEIPQQGGLEWKCVYGREGAKYEGTFNVFRTQQVFGVNQPEGGTEESEDAEIRVPNKNSSTLVYNVVYREYIDGRGVHQGLHGDQYAGEWFGGLRQGHGTHTWVHREQLQTFDDLYKMDQNDRPSARKMKELREAKIRKDEYPLFSGKPELAYLPEKAEEPGWIRQEDGEMRGKHGAFPDVYQWTTADNLVGTYSGQWYRDTPEGCGVMIWSDGTSLAGEWRRGAYVGNFPVCTHQETDFHMRLGQLASQKAKMFQYKPQDMTVIHEKPHLWQHPYFYDDGDQWRAPGPIHKFYEVPNEYKARVERMDAEREAWLDGFKNAGNELPDWQQQWTAIEAVEQQQLVQVNFGEPSPLMEIAEQAQKTDNDDVHEQLRLSAAARGAILPSVRELHELASGLQMGPGQLLTLLAQGQAPPLAMEDIEATVQFVDKYGEEGLIGVDDKAADGGTRPMTVERARELLLDAIPETLLRQSRQDRGTVKNLEPPPVNLLRLETQPMRAAAAKDSPEQAQAVKERVLRRSEEALQELADQLAVALRLKRLPGLPLQLDEGQRDYLRKVKDEYQGRLNAIRERRLRALAVDNIPASEGNMGGLDLSDVERKARLERLQLGRERALLPEGEEVVGGEEEPRGWQEKDDRGAIQALAEREEEAEDLLILPGMKPDELKRTQKHAQRFYNLELETTEKLLEFSRLLENYSRVSKDLPLEKPSSQRPPLLPAHAPGTILNPLPPVNTPAEASEAIRSSAHKFGFGPLRGINRFMHVLRARNRLRPETPPTPFEAYAEYLEELPVRSKLEWTADDAPRVAVGPGGEVIEAEGSFEYLDSLERLRAERAQLAEEVRREQDALLAEEASTYTAGAMELARREAAALQSTKLDSRFWGTQNEDDKKMPIHEWEPKQLGKSEEELVAASQSIRDEIERRLQAARDAEEDAEFNASFSREENEERQELQEALKRKRATMNPEAQLDALLAQSTLSQPGARIQLELAIEEANVGEALPVPAAAGAEPYDQRVQATLHELREVELERMRAAAQKTKERLTVENGEEDEEDEDAALEAEAVAQIEGAEQPGDGEDSGTRLERLEKKIMDLKWERFLKQEKEANKAFELLGTTYEPLLLAQKRLISGLRNRQLAIDSRLEGALTEFFAQYAQEFEPGEDEQARIFDAWLAKWVNAEKRLDAEPLEQLAERAQAVPPVPLKQVQVPQDCPPVLKDFLAKLAELEKQREAEAQRAQQEWEAGRFLALPAPSEAPPARPSQEVPPLELHDGLDAVEIAQKRARQLLTVLQTERVEAEVTRQLRAEIAAPDGGWDLRKASKVLRTLGRERRRQRAAEWDRVLDDAYNNGNLDKYTLLRQLERTAHEQLGLQGELPRSHILWAPLLRPPPPFSAVDLAGNPSLPLPFRVGKENLLARLRSNPESPLYDGSEETDPIFQEGAPAWEAAADAYGGVYRPPTEEITEEIEADEKLDSNPEWEEVKESGTKWLEELQTSILDAEVPGWKEQVAAQTKGTNPFSGFGGDGGLAVLAEHPLFDLQVKPVAFREQVAARLAVAQMTDRVFGMLDMKRAPGTDQAEYVYAPKTYVTGDAEESNIWDDPERPPWTPDLSIYEEPEAVRYMVQWQLKRLAKDVPAPSEMPPPGSSVNFEAAVEQRKKQVLKSLLKNHQPREYQELPTYLRNEPEKWRPGENEFTASVAEVNRFIESVKSPKDLETTVASLRRVVAAQQEFAHIVERGQSLMTADEQRFAKEFLVPKMSELKALENKLWKDGLLLAYDEPEVVAFWKAEWDACEAMQSGLAGVLGQPAAKRTLKEHEQVEKELEKQYKKLDNTLSQAKEMKAKDAATAAKRLSGDEYLAPEVDYNGRPVLTGAPEEVGANPEEEWELAYEEMERVDGNSKFYVERDEKDDKFFEDGLRKARDAIAKLGSSAVFDEDLANFTRTLFKDDLQLAKELLGPEEEQADREKDESEEDEYEEVEVEVEEDEDEDEVPEQEGDFWEVLRKQLKATSPEDLDEKVAEEKSRVLTLKDVLPDEQESRIVAQVEAEKVSSKKKVVLWNMTEDDENKIDIFSVAPDGKFSKFDENRHRFLPYADMDALAVNPASFKPRPGSKEDKAIKEAEEEAAWQREMEKFERGLEEDVPTDAVEVDAYGYAVEKSGVAEEEQESKLTGVESRRQPWYSNEPFWDYFEIPKPVPELTLDHEKDFFLEGEIWEAAAKTPWTGDKQDKETLKARVDAAERRLRLEDSAENQGDRSVDLMMADSVDEVEQEMLRSVIMKPEGLPEFLLSRNPDGTLNAREMPAPESQEEREERLMRESAEAAQKADSDADSEWRRLLSTEQADDEEVVELPPDMWFSPEVMGETTLPDDEDVEISVLEEEVGGEDDEGDEMAEDDDLDDEERAEFNDAIAKINRGEFVMPRLPDWLRRIVKRKPAKPPKREAPVEPLPPPPEIALSQPLRDPGSNKTASITLGALHVLPDYTDAVRWVSKVSADIKRGQLRPAKRFAKSSTASKGSKPLKRGKQAYSIDRGCFSLAVPLGKWNIAGGFSAGGSRLLTDRPGL